MFSTSTNIRLSWLQNIEHMSMNRVTESTRNIITGREEILKKLPLALQKYTHENSLEFDEKKVINSTNLVSSYHVSGILNSFNP